MSDKISKTDEEWRQQLSPEQFRICRDKGTEIAFTGQYWDCKEDGTYRCVCCGKALFSADTKFDSGTGWPSFFEPMSEEAVSSEPEDSYGMRRVEVLCNGCGAHLGHVFDDGPAPTHKRYCINSASLELDQDVEQS